MAGMPEWTFIGYRSATRDLSTIDRSRKTRNSPDMIRTVAMLVCSAVAASAAEPVLIPRPISVREQPGTLVLAADSLVLAPPELIDSAVATLSAAAACTLKPAPAGSPGRIQFLAANARPDALPMPQGEGYVMRITPDGVNIHAATPAGHFYGLQSLAQALATANPPRTLVCADIVDAPRFGWRGFMLDESRHFTGITEVKRLLDTMASYKLNRLHWHLTDSPGWRIEIKKFPRLTEIGSRGSETDRSKDAPPQFYTQDQIRELVAYAKARHITLIPEIEMPGHADAAGLSYPEHSGGGFIADASAGKWPNFTFNPAKPETLAFLDDILTEIAGLFPDAGVIHFGGDEVNFGWQHWTDLPDVKSLMQRENLKDLNGIETWFNRRMAASINKLGFTTGGWDEVTARGLPRDKTLVFWWRHDHPQVLRRALDDGYQVVLCPQRPCYLDFVQHDSHLNGRRANGFNPLADVYGFPDSLKELRPGDAPQVLGIQANLWTETTVTQQRRDFLTWPRLVALAEAAWTPASRKDYAAFETHLKVHLPLLRARGLAPWDPFAASLEVVK